MTDVMLDLETWGTAPGCAIRSIGACTFAREGDVPMSTFYRNVSTESCLRAGLRIELATKTWWDRQSQGARDALLAEQVDLARAVTEFHAWFRGTGAEIVWCHGANFDDGIWQAACRAIGATAPWKFWNVRCTRTTYDLLSYDPRSRTRDGMHHNALDDALHQAACVREALLRRSMS